MIDKPEDMGNAVKIDNRIIPACNIQLEGVPGWIRHSDGTMRWYGIFFEIMFEDGSAWTVTQGDAVYGRNTLIMVEEFFCFHNGRVDLERPDVVTQFYSWELFVDYYDAYLLALHKYNELRIEELVERAS